MRAPPGLLIAIFGKSQRQRALEETVPIAAGPPAGVRPPALSRGVSGDHSQGVTGGPALTPAWPPAKGGLAGTGKPARLEAAGVAPGAPGRITPPDVSGNLGIRHQETPSRPRPSARRKADEWQPGRHRPGDTAAPAETRSARLLRALAQNPEPLSAPALASLLAEPGQRRRLLASYDQILHRHEQAGHVQRAAARPRDAAAPPSCGASPPQAAAGSTNTRGTSPRRGRPGRSTTQDRTGPAQGRRTGTCTGRSPRNLQPPDSADQPQTRRSPAERSRLHPRPDAAVFHVSKERIRQDLLWDPAARKPRRKPKPRKNRIDT